MAAANTDLFRKGTNNFSTTLSGSIAAGDTTITLASTTNLPTDTGIDLVIDRVDASGNKTPNAREYLIGVVSGSNIISILRGKGGSSAASHNSGAVVEYVYTQDNHNDRVTAWTVGHTQLGAHAASLALTTPKITTSLLDTNALTWILQSATASAVNWLQIANAATGTDPIISAAGSGTNLNVNIQGKGTGKLTLGKGAISPFPYDYVASGGIITADSVAVNKNYSFSSGVVVINGNPLNLAAVSAQTVGASQDRYIDLTDNGDGTCLVTNTEVANNSASPALAANGLRLGIVVAGATTIAATTSINQGQEDRVLPIASSIAYTKTDSIGNLICPRDPKRQIVGYRQIVTDFNTASSPGDITGLNLNFKIPTGRQVRVSGFIPQPSSSVANNAAVMTLVDVTAGANLALGAGSGNASGDIGSASPFRVYTPSATTINVKATLGHGANAATTHTNGSTTNPVYLMVELV